MAWTFLKFLMITPLEARVRTPYLTTNTGQTRVRFLPLNLNLWRVEIGIHPWTQKSLEATNDGQRLSDSTTAPAKKSLVGCWMQEMIYPL
jgi:hypothetical protein